MRNPTAHGVFSWGLLLATMIPAHGAAQIPTSFTNLQVLPKDMPRAELVATMRNIASALGVRCTHCHVGPDNLEGMDFATDQKENKQVARAMLRMVRRVNTEFIDALPVSDSGRQPVTCITCHRRSVKPPVPLHDLLFATISRAGLSAAVAQYRQLRTEALDSGLYDFREHSLNIVATRLREQKQFANAIAVLKLNAEIFPTSAAVQTHLGDAAELAGDRALARASYLRALEIDPENATARRGLAQLEKN